MESLRCVRVFDCRQGIPAPGAFNFPLPSDARPITRALYCSCTASKKFIRLSFERAMFPGAPPSKLKAYALHLDSTTTASLFDKIPSDRLETLRISGNAKMRAGLKFPALRHLALHGVTGIDLDRRPLHENIIGCELESFAYSMGERMAFEIRDATLKSLIGGIGKHLRKLVLLDCSRVSSEALMVCLGELPDLEYFALALVTVSELRYDFVASLSSKLLILKLDIRNAWFASPLPDEEQRICDSTETNFLRRRPSPDELQIRVRDTHWTEDGREGRWRDLSVTRGIRLLIGPWTANEEV
ncbi:hypothetical protein FA95DRAFT_1554300 [Auriscalpium vulgare]|uniref:Uncharacterized protein n=1 Tax=Auriscalpium vulgare TaxID=40419 RepID=A0ACB8S6H7_9AGAM|nr:hypothetical protein FA95DRAFT_1554300 [Auriscalpium vulgare]